MSGSTVLIDASALTRNDPRTSLGPRAAQQGDAIPARSTTPEEIIIVMRQAGHDRHGLRLRALIAFLWRGGLRISEALALTETDIDAQRGSLLVRHGKGDSAARPAWTSSASNSPIG